MKRVPAIVACVLVLAGVVYAVYELLHSKRSNNSYNAADTLMALAAAQQDFRVNDRDGNKKQDYWRGPLSGLYLLKDPRGERVKLIEISLAGADVEAGPEVEEFVTRTPKAGYLFKALRFRGENLPDPDRFAACALPETKSAGKNMYIVSHQRILYQKPSQPGGIDVYPDDPIKEGWQKVPGR